MRNVIGLAFVGFLAFLVVADETPASFLSRLTVLFNGPDYALRVFPDQVPLGRVLASDEPPSGKPHLPACRVAVVELAEDAPQRPPVVPLIEQDSARFGGNWRPTPLPTAAPSMPDLLALCGDRIDRLSREALALAMAEPGAFVIRDWKNATLQIYAPKQRLAAHLSLK